MSIKIQTSIYLLRFFYFSDFIRMPVYFFIYFYFKFNSVGKKESKYIEKHKTKEIKLGKERERIEKGGKVTNFLSSAATAILTAAALGKRRREEHNLHLQIPSVIQPFSTLLTPSLVIIDKNIRNSKRIIDNNMIKNMPLDTVKDDKINDKKYTKNDKKSGLKVSSPSQINSIATKVIENKMGSDGKTQKKKLSEGKSGNAKKNEKENMNDENLNDNKIDNENDQNDQINDADNGDDDDDNTSCNSSVVKKMRIEMKRLQEENDELLNEQLTRETEIRVEVILLNFFFCITLSLL